MIGERRNKTVKLFVWNTSVFSWVSEHCKSENNMASGTYEPPYSPEPSHVITNWTFKSDTQRWVCVLRPVSEVSVLEPTIELQIPKPGIENTHILPWSGYLGQQKYAGELNVKSQSRGSFNDFPQLSTRPILNDPQTLHRILHPGGLGNTSALQGDSKTEKKSTQKNLCFGTKFIQFSNFQDCQNAVTWGTRNTESHSCSWATSEWQIPKGLHFTDDLHCHSPRLITPLSPQRAVSTTWFPPLSRNADSPSWKPEVSLYSSSLR